MKRTHHLMAVSAAPPTRGLSHDCDEATRTGLAIAVAAGAAGACPVLTWQQRGVSAGEGGDSLDMRVT